MSTGVRWRTSRPGVDPYLVKRSRDTFHVAHLTAQDFAEHRPRGIIGMVPGEIVTEDQGYSDHIDVEWDILKAAVVERHKNTRHIGIGYLQGYGLKSGAVATSVSHDSHNIIGWAPTRRTWPPPSTGWWKTGAASWSWTGGRSRRSLPCQSPAS